MKKLFFLAIAIFIGFMADCQVFTFKDIPFSINGKNLDIPMIGGILAPQFQSFDLDGEGPEDMVVFDRNGNVILPLISHSTPGNPTYEYAPQYTGGFPKAYGFIRLADFDGDGKKDFFTLSQIAPAIEVWHNTSTAGQISFELVTFDYGNGDYIQIPDGDHYTNLYVSTVDIPAIEDMDGDGDLDILNFDAGGSHIYYYQNMAMEMDNPDTLVYRLVDDCWGNVEESGISAEVILSDSRDKCPGTGGFNTGQGYGVRHAGSTLTAFDGDGDGDMDLVLGDLTNKGVVYLENDKQQGDDFIVNITKDYPVSLPVDVNIFLAAFYIDVDNDGRRDLIIAPNNAIGSDNIHHIWYYKNTGTDNAPQFDFVTKDFLINQSLVMGKSSSAVFCDFNGDGLKDILVGVDGLIDDGQISTSLYLYENTGTKSAPAYTLVDDDFLGLKSIFQNEGAFLSPAVGDIDGDGDDDIIVGVKSGKLLFFENVAGQGITYDFAGYIFPYMDIDVGSIANPAIFDVDADGLADLVVGEKNDNPVPGTTLPGGGLNFFKNIGNPGSPAFGSDPSQMPNTPVLGRVFTRGIYVSGYSAPSFFYSESDALVAVGSNGGDIYLYRANPDSIYGHFDLISEHVDIIPCGRRTHISLAEIDDDGLYEMMVSSENGGLRIFDSDLPVGQGSSIEDYDTQRMTVYPNPGFDKIYFSSDDDLLEVRLVDLNGRLVLKKKIDRRGYLDVSTIEPGVYLIKTKSNKGREMIVKWIKSL